MSLFTLKSTGLSVIFFCVVLALRAQEVAKTLSFEECIQIALTNSTVAVKGINAVEISGAQVLAAHGQFLPDAVVSGVYSYTGGTNLLTFTTPTLVNSHRSNISYQIVSSIHIYNSYSNRASLRD